MDAARATLITRIRQHNPGADRRFLARFAEQALRQYLDHLEGDARRLDGWVGDLIRRRHRGPELTVRRRAKPWQPKAA